MAIYSYAYLDNSLDLFADCLFRIQLPILSGIGLFRSKHQSSKVDRFVKSIETLSYDEKNRIVDSYVDDLCKYLPETIEDVEKLFSSTTSSNKKVDEAVSRLQEQYEKLTVHERICLIEWSTIRIEKNVDSIRTAISKEILKSSDSLNLLIMDQSLSIAQNISNQILVGIQEKNLRKSPSPSLLFIELVATEAFHRKKINERNFLKIIAIGSRFVKAPRDFEPSAEIISIASV
jgi:hypothetical protein